MLNILVVEDDEKTRDIFTRFFGGKGHRVQEARDGQEAVQLASQRPFDLVLLDVKMPKLDGLSAFQQIKQQLPQVKVVLMTGFAVDEQIEQALKAGACDCLHKPVLLKDLEALLDRLEAPPSEHP